MRTNANEGEKRGVIFILLAGVMWGTISLFVRRLNALGLDAMQVVFLRVLLAAVLILALVLVKDRRLLRIRLRDPWCFLGTGICSILLFYTCYFHTIAHASAAAAAVLLYTAPVFVTLLSRLLFRERLTKRKLTACGLAVVGCALVSGLVEGGDHGLTLGTLATGLLSGFGYALYSIFGRYALDRGYHSFTTTAWTFLIAAVCLAPFVDYGAIGAALSVDTGAVLLFSLGIAVFVTVIPYLLYTAGLETILSSRASIMASVEPVVASIISVTVFGERMSLLGALGVLLVLGAVVLLNLPQKIHKS